MSSAFPDHDPHRLPDPESSRASTPPGNGAKILVYLLFLLAVIATVIMFFVDNDAWQKIAVIAALWAAFIGAVLVSRYSGQLGEEKARNRELEARSAGALDSERARSRARELELERNYNDRVQEGRDETIASIREELAALRLQLSELSGLDLSEEQVSVRARAERIVELERTVQRAEDKAAEPTTDDSSDTSVSSETSPSVEGHRGGRQGGFATGSFTAVNWSGADSEATTQIPLVVSENPLGGSNGTNGTTGTDSTTAGTGVHERPAGPSPSTNGWEPRVPDAGAQAGKAGKAGQAAQPEPGHHRRPATPDEGESRGRRRADDSAAGVTVAELMAQLKKNSK
ncbi:DUF6779 domain-containing protein [Corynebacterium nuruki]|uniref:DUF6779 domain-containing protein n=1 Tax=Corynebacterium nuruki TaxID=1032851 RepID=UPI0039BFE264